MIFGAGAIVTALIFVVTSMPHRGGPEKAKNRAATSKDESAVETTKKSNDHSLFPITDSWRPEAEESGSSWSQEEQGTVSKLGMPTEAFTLWIKGPFAVT